MKTKARVWLCLMLCSSCAEETSPNIDEPRDAGADGGSTSVHNTSNSGTSSATNVAPSSSGSAMTAPNTSAADSRDQSSAPVDDSSSSQGSSVRDAGSATDTSDNWAQSDAGSSNAESTTGATGVGTDDTADESGGPIVIPWPDAGVAPGELPFPVETTLRPDASAPEEPADELDVPGRKVDLLFVIDNSKSMSDKQALLRDAVPTLLDQLLASACRTDEDERVPANGDGSCPNGSTLEPTSVEDLHVAVITTSLGGYGARDNCVYRPEYPASEQGVDMAHLIGSLPRGAGVQAAATDGFLSWTTGDDVPDLVNDLAALVDSAGEQGCGWEAPLEAMVRFLVDPYPYTRVTRQPCVPSDTGNNCGRPEVDEEGRQLVDATLLAQRQKFLRPDSAVSIVLLSDENDCSFRASGQSWLLAESTRVDGAPSVTYRASAACDDPAYGPNHECCQSCGQFSVPNGCPTAANVNDVEVAVGCEQSVAHDELDDGLNLRCFEQKRRFGVDFLYPVRRYTNALTQEFICPDALGLDREACATPVRNPLFALIDGKRRPTDWITVSGIVGVPWTALAVDPDDDAPLVYRSTDAAAEFPVEWSWVVGDATSKAEDPLMWEQVESRSGQSPATGESLELPNAARRANSINGHEWNITNGNDLQFACIFELPEPVSCPTEDEAAVLEQDGVVVPSCDCTLYGADEFQNPLCQTPQGDYGLTQYAAKAYPGLRQLEFLQTMGANATVGSICPKQLDPEMSDYGYRPVFDALIQRLDQSLDD